MHAATYPSASQERSTIPSIPVDIPPIPKGSIQHKEYFPNMPAAEDTVIRQMLEIDLPPDASENQTGVKSGYYRTVFNRVKSLRNDRRARYRPRSVEDTNNKAVIGDNTWFKPKGEEMVVKVDRFMDRATCPECHGRGHSAVTCADCGGSRVWYMDSLGNRDKRAGTDKSQLKQVECTSCKASEARNPYPRATGKVPCQPCRGTGQRVGDAGIAVADAFTAEPTTGIVLATGPRVTEFDRGQRIFFSQYAGIEYEYDGRKYRIINQRYPLGIIVGSGDVHAYEAANGGQR